MQEITRFMKETNPRLALYREAMALEEKRAALQAQLENVSQQLNATQAKLFNEFSADDAVSSSGSSSAASGQKLTPARSLAGKRAGRGELKNQLLRILSTAGSTGVSVKEITAEIGAKATSVHSWLQSARKKYPIKRVSQGRYRIEGAVAIEAPKAPKAAKPGRPGKRSTRPLSGRGELLAKIMGELKAAGDKGVKVPDLADKFGVKRKNLFIWFATTGRRNPAIKKVGESHYRLEA